MIERPRETVMQVLLQHDLRHVLYYVVLLEIAKATRAAWPPFELQHFVLLADHLEADLLDIQIRPRELNPTSEGVGLVAAGVWDEGPDARWQWRTRILDVSLPDPSETERSELLDEVRKLPFVQRASWAVLTK